MDTTPRPTSRRNDFHREWWISPPLVVTAKPVGERIDRLGRDLQETLDARES